MIANLIRSFLNPSIINGIASAPFMVFHPDTSKLGTNLAYLLGTNYKIGLTESLRFL